MTLDDFNTAPHEAAVTQLLSCCGSARWARQVADKRPYSTPAQLLSVAESIWFSLSEPDWLEAFACHPRIGERRSATTNYLAHSESEQAAAQSSLDAVAEALLLGNQEYEAKFGFLYIVFASGRSAPELLAVLQSRLGNSREAELHEAARQQMRITNLRLGKWLQS